MLIGAIILVMVTGEAAKWREISPRTWLFLGLSGAAPLGSWLCFYRALQLGSAGKVSALDRLSLHFTLVLTAPFLGEAFTFKTALSLTLIGAGTALLLQK